MRSDVGPIRILSPRAQHAVAAELRTHELVVDAIAIPASRAAAPQFRTIPSLPLFLLVRKPSKRQG